MKATIIKIKEEKVISTGNGLISSYVCEITRKDGSVHTVEMRANHLTELYRQAEEKNIIFEVAMEDYQDTDFTIEELSFEEVEGNEVDVYTHVYNFSEEVDFSAVISNEDCMTLTARKFKNFKKKNSDKNWK